MRIPALVGVIACASGCFTTWEPQHVETSYARDERAPLLRLRSDALPGTAEVGANGEIALKLDVGAACQSIPWVHAVRSIEEREELSAVGIASIVVGAAAMLGSLAGVGTVTGEYCSKYGGCMYGPHEAYTSSAAAMVGLGGLVLALAPLGTLPGGRHHHHRRTRVREEVDVDVVKPSRADATIGISCGDGPAVLRTIGEVVLVTPWGAEVHAWPDASGMATFAVDWTAPGAFVESELVDDAEPTSWRFVAAHAKLDLAWQPTSSERERLAALIAAPK